jgi:hypothetical protein
MQISHVYVSPSVCFSHRMPFSLSLSGHKWVSLCVYISVSPCICITFCMCICGYVHNSLSCNSMFRVCASRILCMSYCMCSLKATNADSLVLYSWFLSDHNCQNSNFTGQEWVSLIFLVV